MIEQFTANETDNHLDKLVTSALAGAAPGEIAEPDHKVGTEGATTTTNGHTYKNY